MSGAPDTLVDFHTVGRGHGLAAAARRAERAGLLALRELVVDLGEHAGRRGVEDEVRDAAHEVGEVAAPVRKSKFYGAFVLNRRVVLHAIDATPA